MYTKFDIYVFIDCFNDLFDFKIDMNTLPMSSDCSLLIAYSDSAMFDG